MTLSDLASIAFVMGSIAILVPNRAYADERWACAYTETDGTATSVQYVRDGEDLIDRQLNVRYHVLVDNKVGLVAASAVADGPTVWIWSVLINKQTGSFQLAEALIGQTNLPTSVGTCSHE